PHRQAGAAGLPHRPGPWLADRHRRDRRGLPAPGRRPAGHHRRPLGPARRRGRPQAARTVDQRRLRRLLALPPRPGTPTRPPGPLPAAARPRRLISRSLRWSHTQRGTLRLAYLADIAQADTELLSDIEGHTV